MGGGGSGGTSGGVRDWWLRPVRAVSWLAFEWRQVETMAHRNSKLLIGQLKLRMFWLNCQPAASVLLAA